eukprot:1158552-Pelagomonas_calceolata.AAC.2
MGVEVGGGGVGRETGGSNGPLDGGLKPPLPACCASGWCRTDGPDAAGTAVGGPTSFSSLTATAVAGSTGVAAAAAVASEVLVPSGPDPPPTACATASSRSRL